MKIRLLTLLSILFLMSNVTFAQSVGEYRVRKTETIKKKIEKPKKTREGSFVIPEVGLGFDDYLDGALWLQGVFGYGFNNHLALGIGTGVNINDDLDLCIPLYVNLRGDITKKPILNYITPYYSFDFGYRFSVLWELEGILSSPELGIRTNKLYIGAKFSYIDSYYESCSLYIKLGYKIPLKKH